jgi:hypothetical protein
VAHLQAKGEDRSFSTNAINDVLCPHEEERAWWRQLGQAAAAAAADKRRRRRTSGGSGLLPPQPGAAPHCPGIITVGKQDAEQYERITSASQQALAICQPAGTCNLPACRRGAHLAGACAAGYQRPH